MKAKNVKINPPPKKKRTKKKKKWFSWNSGNPDWLSLHQRKLFHIIMSYLRFVGKEKKTPNVMLKFFLCLSHKNYNCKQSKIFFIFSVYSVFHKNCVLNYQICQLLPFSPRGLHSCLPVSQQTWRELFLSFIHDTGETRIPICRSSFQRRYIILQ